MHGVFGFVMSVVLSLGAGALAVAVTIARRVEDKRSPTEGMSAWDHMTGKSIKAVSDQGDFMVTTQRWVVSLATFSAVSAIFAIVSGVGLWG